MPRKRHTIHAQSQISSQLLAGAARGYTEEGTEIDSIAMLLREIVGDFMDMKRWEWRDIEVDRAISLLDFNEDGLQNVRMGRAGNFTRAYGVQRRKEERLREPITEEDLKEMRIAAQLFMGQTPSEYTEPQEEEENLDAAIERTKAERELPIEQQLDRSGVAAKEIAISTAGLERQTEEERKEIKEAMLKSAKEQKILAQEKKVD